MGQCTAVPLQGYTTPHFVAIVISALLPTTYVWNYWLSKQYPVHRDKSDYLFKCDVKLSHDHRCKAPAPVDEDARLRQIELCGALDGSNFSYFDSLAAAAAKICQQPIAFISILGGNQQVIAGMYGLPPARWLPRRCKSWTSAHSPVSWISVV